MLSDTENLTQQSANSHAPQDFTVSRLLSCGTPNQSLGIYIHFFLSRYIFANKSRPTNYPLARVYIRITNSAKSAIGYIHIRRPRFSTRPRTRLSRAHIAHHMPLAFMPLWWSLYARAQSHSFSQWISRPHALEFQATAKLCDWSLSLCDVVVARANTHKEAALFAIGITYRYSMLHL